LQLAAQKWSSFQISGNDDYKALCVNLAAEHGFKISNPELQVNIESERQRMRAVQKTTAQQPAREPGLVR
jgi:hypothetical protein